MNDKWMESGFMLIQQVAHLAKYQTLKEMESCGLKPNQAGILVVLRSEGGLSQERKMSVFLENDGKSKENDELCRTKIAGIAEKNGKTRICSAGAG
mgnify:CR=1 FL=1